MGRPKASCPALFSRFAPPRPTRSIFSSGLRTNRPATILAIGNRLSPKRNDCVLPVKAPSRMSGSMAMTYPRLPVISPNPSNPNVLSNPLHPFVLVCTASLSCFSSSCGITTCRSSFSTFSLCSISGCVDSFVDFTAVAFLYFSKCFK